MGMSVGSKQLISFYSRRVYPVAGLLLVIMVVQAGLQLLQPWPLSIAIDSVFADKPYPSIIPGQWSKTTLLNVLAAAGLIFLVVRSIISYIDSKISMRANFAIDSQVRRDALLRVLRLTPEGKSLSDGEYDYRINTDARAVADRVLGVRLSYAYSILMFCFASFILFRLNVALAALAIAMTPLSLLPVKLFSNQLALQNKRIKEQSSAIRSLVIESVSQSRTIQLFARESSQAARFMRKMKENYDLGISKFRISFLFQFLESTSSVLAGAIILLFGGHQVLQGSLTAGELIVFLGYRSMLSEPLRKMVTTVNEQKNAEISVDRVYELFDINHSPYEKQHDQELLALDYPITGKIEFRNVSVSRGGKTILHDINLVVEPGKKIAIIGQSGSGKSTFINLLPRFVLPDQGQITIDDHDITDIGLYELRNLFSIVDQNPQLFTMSIEENIAFGTPDFIHLPDRSYIADVAIVSDAFDFIMELPETFDAKVGRGEIALSGGQKQRIAIARALAKNSPIIILDEPTSALDDVSARKVLTHVSDYFVDRTTIVVTHSKQLLDMMDEVYELQNGTLHQVRNYVDRIHKFDS